MTVQKNSLSLSRGEPWIWILAGLILYLPGLGSAHLFDWDEINFAEISREMLVTGDFLTVQVNYHSFWEKPPLFFWMQCASMKIFGINEFAARFPNAICGILTLLSLLHLGSKHFSITIGRLWALAYLGSILPLMYFKSGILDPWFNLLILWGLVYMIQAVQKFQADFSNFSFYSLRHYAVMAGLFTGLAMLIKGPVAYLILCLCLVVYTAMRKIQWKESLQVIIPFSLVALTLGFSWHIGLFITQGHGLAIEFFRYQLRLFSTADAGHAGFPGYHLVVLLVGVFPASLLSIPTLFKNSNPAFEAQRIWILWMKILFWIVLILFSIVQSKIVHYSSLAYFPITFLAAMTMTKLIEGIQIWNRWLRIGLLALGGFIALLLFIAPFIGNHIDALKPFFHQNAFALANLEAKPTWSYALAAGGIGYLALLLWSAYLLRNQIMRKGIYLMFGSTALCVVVGMMFSVNNIEAYSQRAAIEFYESKATEDCYLHPYGFKTYAHLFYGKVKPFHRATKSNFEWLLNGPIDQPVYFIAKNKNAKDLRSIQYLKELYQKNGFVFFKREIDAHPPAQ